MNAADAQFIVIGFLNLACRIAIVVLVAGMAEGLLRRHGAALRAFVWTMALASVIVAICAQLAGFSGSRPAIRLREVRIEQESRGTDSSYLPEVGSLPVGGARKGAADYEAADGSEEASSAEVQSKGGFELKEAGEGNGGGERMPDMAEARRDDASYAGYSSGQERRAGDASGESRLKEKVSVWQFAGWGVVFLCFVSVLLIIRVVVGTLGLRNLVLRWRGRTPPEALIEMLKGLKEDLRIRQAIRLLVSPKNGAPITFGIFRPTIILPVGVTERLGPEGIRQMVAHELAHVRRYDCLAILLQRVCMALCFWHPLVHMAVGRLSILIEDACDDYVLRMTRAPQDYAACLTQLAEEKCCGIGGIAGWIGTRRRRLKLEKRIERILDSGRRIGRVTGVEGMATVAFAVVICFAASRVPVLGIAGEDRGLSAKGMPDEIEALKPLEGEAPLEHGRRLLEEGHARVAIDVLRRAIAETEEAGALLSLRYEVARAYHVLADAEALEETLSEVWGRLPGGIEHIEKFADFCIATGQEGLAREAIKRLQEMEPERRVYHASKLYGAFPKPEELWFPFQPGALEKTRAEVGKRQAVMYHEQLTPALARVVQAADLDGDGAPEVIVAAKSRTEPAWIRVFSPAGELLWKEEKEEGEQQDDILVFDLDGDGKLEIIAAGLNIIAYDCKGKILWQRPCPRAEHGHGLTRTRIVQSSEDRYRIISGVDNRIVCFSPDGKVEWEKIGVLGDSFITTDFNGDGWDEILTMKIADTELVVFDQKGAEIVSTPTDLNLSGPRLAMEDLDRDGKPEIIGWGGGEKLLVCGMDGKALWKTRSRKGPLYAIGDLDGDGKKEIACVTPSEEVRVVNHDGSTRLELAIATIALQLVDIDGDGKDEIFAESRPRPGRYLFCIGGDGQLRWRFPLPRSYTYGFHAMPGTKAGRKGIVAVASQALITLSAEGDVISITPMACYPNALSADLDGDGAEEVLADAPLLRAYHLRRNEALWGGMATQDIMVDSGAIAIDVGGDGAEEIVFTCRGYVCIVNGKGELVHAKYVGESGEPVLGRIDVEGDGKDEILLCDNRRFVILNGEGEVTAAASHQAFEVHRGSYVPPHKVILAADIDSVAGDEIVTCIDGDGVTAYSPDGRATMRFRRPSWLPVHPEYERMSYFWRPQIFPPMDVNGDGRKELVARIDRLFVWNRQGELLRIGLNDYPGLEQISVGRLKRKLEGIARYVRELGARGTIAEYMEKAEKKPLMEPYTSALVIRAGKEAQFVICGEKAMSVKRADGEILWRVPAESPGELPREPVDYERMPGEDWRVLRIGLRCVGFGDLDGDGRKEIMAYSQRWSPADRKQFKQIEAFSVRGEHLWRGAHEDPCHFCRPVCDDFDGDGFMEITLEYEPGIAILDLTPR